MGQATDWGVPGAGPATPTDYASRDNDSFDALLSNHSGTARPTYAVAETIWIKQVGSPTTYEIYFYDGTDDILLYTVDPAANSSSLLNSDLTRVLNVGYTNAANNLGNINSATTILISDGSFQYGTMTGAFTLTAPTDADEGAIELELAIDATGGYAITFTGFTAVSGDFDNAANAVNYIRITKNKTNTLLEIVQAA